MSFLTLEGIIDQGQVHLLDNVRLPDKTRVYILVPDEQIERTVRIESPRLAHPEQAADFAMEVSSTVAGV